jgi:PAS domain S-box-containing protein
LVITMASVRILVVVDDDSAARDLHTQLAALDFTVVGTLASAVEAIDSCGELRPDLVLMDYRLGEIVNGRSIVQAIHARCRLPVVYLMAEAVQAAPDQSRLGEPDGWLWQPFNAWELRAVLETVRHRFQADHALRGSETRFRAFLDRSPLVAFIKDAEGRYVFANRPWEQQFRPSRSDWFDRTDFDFWPEETARRFQASDREALAAGKPVEKLETGCGPDGSVRRWLIHRVAWKDTQERTFVGGISLDMAGRTRLDEQLRQAQKIEAIGRLAGRVAHEFNNLLTVIIGYARLLQEQLAGQAALHELADEIARAGGRAADLTQQLLLFSRKPVLLPQVIDINSLIRNSERVLARLLPRNIQLHTSLATDLRLIRFDPRRLEQVLLILALNSRDAMPAGGQLTIATSNVQMSEGQSQVFPSMQPGIHVQLVVADTGCGMDDATRSRLFEPFFTTRADSKGSGLGLATVYGTVKQSGGWIEVQSGVDQGTTFTLLFPAVAPGSEPHAPLPPTAANAVSEVLLLVEDDDTVRSLSSVILQQCGYLVLEARTGPEALKLLEKHSRPLHLVITDMDMPHMSGRALASLIVQQRPGSRILFVSGRVADETELAAIPGGITAFLPKPFTPSTLKSKVRQLLDVPPDRPDPG